MSFTSLDLRGWFHIFTSLPLVHTLNPDFLKLRLWLGFPQIPESFIHNSRISGVWTNDFASSWFQSFAGSWFQIFAGSWFQIIADSRLEDFAGLWFRIFTDSRLEGFAGSWLQSFTYSITLQRTADSREIASFSCYFRILFENLFHEIQQTHCFEGVRFFLNSPTLAPWGSGLTPTIRFHENFRILVKTTPLERRSGHASSRSFTTVESRKILRFAPSPL
jgi:hypothetical protein